MYSRTCANTIGFNTCILILFLRNKEPYSKKITRAKKNAENRRKKAAQLKAKKLEKRELKKTADKQLLKGDLFAAEVKDIWAEGNNNIIKLLVFITILS